MENTRSIITRNFVGAFLGGLAGILSSWFITPAALPIGVLLGVVIGWWHRDIVHVCRETYRQAKLGNKKAASSIADATDYVVEAIARFSGLSPKIARVLRWILTKAIVGPLVAVALAPGRFWRWLTSHPANQTAVIDGATILLFVIGLPYFVWLFVEPHYGMVDKNNQGLLTVLSVFAVLGGGVMHRMRYEFTGNAALGQLRLYYREWEVISRYGWLGFFFYEVATLARYTLGCLVFATVAIPWLLVSAMIGMIGAIPMVVVISIAQGLYEIVKRTGHRLCLGVTMIVTVLFWYFYHQRFADPRVLWTVALGAGVVSGVITEGARRMMLAVSTEKAERLFRGEVMYDVVIGEGEGNGYMGNMIIKIGCLWFRQSRLARLFRTICFNTPIVQPV